MTDTASAVSLPREIDEHLERYVTAFNAGDADTVNSCYTPEAVAVWEPGSPLSGDARRAYTEEFLASRKPSIDTDVREAYVTGDTALLVVDWTMELTGDDGARERLRGVGLDVLRLTEDGRWLYAVDDPFGEEPREAA